MLWPVVPLCEKQLLDVRPEDVLCGGHFRKCNTYRGGGGYDRFPAIAKKRLGVEVAQQFVVQLKGCPLKCPYCYVTNDGITGEHIPYTTEQLVAAYKDSGHELFHLMGGAPALYMQHWPELIYALRGAVFHSDLLLMEYKYTAKDIKAICKPNCLYAVSIKGWNPDEWARNTGVHWRTMYRVFYNLDKLLKYGDPKCFYFTFTNMDDESIYRFKKEYTGPWLDDAFSIDLVNYEALSR